MNLYIADLIFSLLFGIVAYLGSNNMYVGIFVLAISSIYFLFVFNSKIKKYSLKAKRYHECYNFINTFIVSLSATDSMIQAYDRTTIRISQSLQKELTGITNLEPFEKVKYLKRYFPFHIYELFLNILDLFIEQGGDILSMSSYLLKEARMIEEYLDSCQTNAIKKVVEIILLWLLSLALLIFVRFGLSQFFESLSKQLFYSISICVFFIFVLISCDISIKRLFDVDIQGFKGYEKVKKLFRKR